MNPAELSSVIADSTGTVFQQHDLDQELAQVEPTVERPRNPEHGDYSTNIALQLAKRAGVNPRDLAQWLADELTSNDAIEEVEIAGPGFINIRLAPDAQGKIVSDILTQGDQYGTSPDLSDENINLEFVSANPTGPIHLGGTRWAAVGDSLGRILQSQGADVTCEYYFNDHGRQLDRFSNSLYAAARNLPTPEDGYGGSYIQEIADEITARRPEWESLSDDDARELFRSEGVGLMFPQIKKSLSDFGTDFDVFFHEQDLYDDGSVHKAIQKLKDTDKLYEKDGAWWLRSTDYGDDKDRVVIKSDGDMAYIAGDIAYVANKFDRGFTRAMYMLGADHHGYIARLRAAASALGYDPEAVEVLIGQMVNLVKDGQPVKMSKRAGTIITLEDLVDAIGVDAARYALLRTSVDSPLDIDMNLWASQSSDNPVYYVQYGHARIASLLRKAEQLGIQIPDAKDVDLSLLTTDKEGELIRTLGEYPAVVKSAAELREPHRIARYVESLAAAFHKFYDDSQILPKPDEDMPVYAARLALAQATKQTIANALGLLGVSAPDRM